MVPTWSGGRVSWPGPVDASFTTVPLPPEIMQHLSISKANLGIQPEALIKQTVLGTLTLETRQGAKPTPTPTGSITWIAEPPGRLSLKQLSKSGLLEPVPDAPLGPLLRQLL